MPSTAHPHPEEPAERASRRTPVEGAAQAHPLRRAMDGLYRLCAIIPGSALGLIALVVPWGGYTRYVLDSPSSLPEPMAILLSIVLAFFGAAACYPSRLPMRVTVPRH